MIWLNLVSCFERCEIQQGQIYEICSKNAQQIVRASASEQDFFYL